MSCRERVGRERIRLFLALVVPEQSGERIRSWQQAELSGASDARCLAELHVTLAFLGHRPRDELEGIARALRESGAGATRPVLRPVRYRETRSVGMLVLDDEDGRATALALDVQHRLERLGVYVPERRAWLPHLTVLRFRKAPRLRPAVPDLGAITPSEAAVYHSVLRSGGAQYEVLESVALGG
jgi:2'-5' RNA ligase